MEAEKGYVCMLISLSFFTENEEKKFAEVTNLNICYLASIEKSLWFFERFFHFWLDIAHFFMVNWIVDGVVGVYVHDSWI